MQVTSPQGLAYRILSNRRDEGLFNGILARNSSPETLSRPNQNRRYVGLFIWKKN